jgi:predicted amidophosphoribosyltransferase
LGFRKNSPREGKLQINLKAIEGNWDAGYALDKHTLSSTYIGDNQFGHPQFNTTRSEVGEALYQLKFRHDKNQAAPIAKEIVDNVLPKLGKIDLIIPMPPSKTRAWQPVSEIAKGIRDLTGIVVFENILIKENGDQNTQLKDMTTKAEKVEALAGRFSINDEITNQGCWNALLVDDLYDTGASMEAACSELKKYNKIGKIYVATASWK